MNVVQTVITARTDLAQALVPLIASAPQLVLVFGAVPYFATPALATLLRQSMPQALLAGCSTAGEIAGDVFHDGQCVVTAITFRDTPLRAATTVIGGMPDSADAGRRLAALLPHADLSAVLLFGTGVGINGSALAHGLQKGLPTGVGVSGGLAADGGAFRQTWTLGPEGAADDQIVAIGLYGEQVALGYGSDAGWEAFGPARRVTRAEDNVLFELDGERALDVYKRYLGAYAKDLPGSGLLFPFEMLGAAHEDSGVIRTILGVDEASGSLTLAGNVDPDGYLRLMHSSTEKLIDAAERAAVSAGAGRRHGDALAILISCIGRKLVMGDRVEEELEAVADTLGTGTTLSGFYSNGEIGPTHAQGGCNLHNQTMTITILSEA